MSKLQHSELMQLYQQRKKHLREHYDRDLPLQDALMCRWERAKELGFGEESNIYNSAFVFGDVTVGERVWVGPQVMLDGSGAALSIGDDCTLATGVHIYTHDTVLSTLSAGRLPKKTGAVSIAKCSYIGSQAIINLGVTIGEQCVIAANSFVNQSIPDRTIVAGNPARKIGEVNVDGNNITLVY